MFVMGILRASVLILLLPLASHAGPFTAIHPEEQYPDPQVRTDSDPYSDLISQAQEKLRSLGFAAGPVNGDFGTKTQAALAQFQLDSQIPVSGQLDERTLAELGIERNAEASAGSTGNFAQ